MQTTLNLPETFVQVLSELSPQHLRVLEQFAQFLHQQDQQGQPVTIEAHTAPTLAEPRNLLNLFHPFLLNRRISHAFATICLL